MIRITFILAFFISVQILPQQILAQGTSQTHINSDINIDKEISELMNELDLSNDQKLYIGMLILKYSLEFDIKEFEEASKMKQYTLAKAKIKEMEKELKPILSKQQYKIYKKHKKELRKELKRSV